MESRQKNNDHEMVWNIGPLKSAIQKCLFCASLYSEAPKVCHPKAFIYI